MTTAKHAWFLTSHKWLSALVIVLILLIAFVLWQVLFIRLNYAGAVLVPNIPRTTEHFGTTGSKVSFVVMGDSTSIGQGADYEQGIARKSTEYLAVHHVVSLTNVGVSGARVADVLQTQTAKVIALKPDLVLLAIGANDVTHITNLGSVRTNSLSVIEQLQATNPNVKIILTGSPAMGAVARFAPPTKWLAAWRVRHINATFASVAKQTGVTLLPLAVDTGPTFQHNPKLFAPDNFHPNAAGYAVWQPTIVRGLQSIGY